MTEDTKQIITVVRLNAPVYKVELIVKINSTNYMRVLNLSFQLSLVIFFNFFPIFLLHSLNCFGNISKHLLRKQLKRCP